MMFLFLYSPGQIIRPVAWQDGDPGLTDDRAAIQFVGNEVDTGAVFGFAGINDPLMCIQTGIGG